MASASQTIDEYLTTLPDWQKRNLELFRKLVHAIDPSVTEDWKWNVPFFMLDGKMLFAASAFKAHTKYNFLMNGALLDDPDKLFNNGFDSKKSRAIDLREGEEIDHHKLHTLIEESLKRAKQ